MAHVTLRARGLLDAVIEACTERPLHRVEPPLLDALRLGASTGAVLTLQPLPYPLLDDI